jgi:hypothetical protein
VIDLGNAVESVAAVVIAMGATWLSLAERRHGVKNWWAYLVSVPFLLYFALAAAFGHPVPGRAA